MYKYLLLFRLFADQYFVYRINFLLWRFRLILNLLLTYFLWSALFLRRRELFGYTEQEMTTYILIIFLLSNLVFSSKTFEVGEEILQGDIINKLLKPISYFSYLMIREITEKVISIGFSAGEIAVLIYVLKPELIGGESVWAVVLALIQLCIGLVIGFFISLSLSFIAFWSSNIWAPRFIYLIVVAVLAGNYFPLDILPNALYLLLLLTPFPYLIYLPVHIFLNGPPEGYIFQFFVSIAWLVVSYTLAVRLWKNGMKEFSFYGK